MINHKPAITVITPVYNAEFFIKETIDSVLCQTFTDFEYFLLDDGSTDNSGDIIRSYNDPRVSYIPCPHDFIGTQNKGFELAKGKYIAQLDHDDLMAPNRLEIQYQFMEENPDIVACGGYMQRFGKRTDIWENPLKHNEIIESMIRFNPVHNSTVMYRRAFLERHHIRLERGYSFTSDYKIFSELAKIGKLVNLPVVLTHYRTSDKQTTALHEKEMAKADIKIKQEMLQYFITLLDDNNRYMHKAKYSLLPLLDKLYQTNYFGYETYYDFMLELFTGLRKQGGQQLIIDN